MEKKIFNTSLNQLITNFCPGKHTSLNFEHKDCSKSNNGMVATLKTVFACVNKGSKGKSEMISFMLIKKEKKKERKDLWFQFKLCF